MVTLFIKKFKLFGLAQGLQKWVGWQEGDGCCLKGDKGIGRKCECPAGVGGQCCTGGGSPGCTCARDDQKCSYKSAYDKEKALWTTIVNGTTGAGGSGSAGSAVGGKGGSGVAGPPADPVKAAQDVHLLARIFLGSVCLIWSGLSQLGFLTGKSDRWSQVGKLHEVDKGLGSFMAAMGYDLERLNGSGGGTGKTGDFVWKLISGTDPKGDKGIQWKEFTKESAEKNSVAEYYSTIYEKAKEAAKGSTEDICTKYPLLVLHILASGYFRAGSAGAKGITSPKDAQTAKPATEKEETPSSRKPRTIREILYWLSALPYSEKYKELVDKMRNKYPPKKDDPKKLEDEIKLYDDKGNGAAAAASTTLQRKDITHYLMAACGYCPLVLIGIQGTIEKEVDKATGGGPGAPAAASQSNNKCPNHKDNRNKRCDPKDVEKQQAATKAAASGGQPLQPGQVCYGGYHLEVSKFGPLHGMYANGLFGFQMDGSPAQCLDQLRVYVYHCFYQLYFLRKQCGTGVVEQTVLGWQSCRYGNGVNGNTTTKWICKTEGASGDDHTKKCGLQDSATSKDASALQSFLCDALWVMVCEETKGRDPSGGKQNYPEIEEHMNKTVDSNGKERKPHRIYPQLCPVPMGWSKGSGTTGENHFKDLTQGSHKTDDLKPSPPGTPGKYPAHCTGNTLSHLLEYYCDPEKCHGTLVVLLRLLACITPTVPRTLGDLFGFYYYVVYIGGQKGGEMHTKMKSELHDARLKMIGGGSDVVNALQWWSGDEVCQISKQGTLKCLYTCSNSAAGQCSQYLSPLSGQQYGQLSPVMAGTYLSWLVYLIEGFQGGLEELETAFKGIDCKNAECRNGQGGAGGCGGGQCTRGTHGNTCPAGSGSAGSAVGGKGGASQGVCGCTSVVSCTGVLPVLYKYGFGYGDVSKLHTTGGSADSKKKCHDFLETLKSVLEGEHLKKDGSSGGLHHEINQLIYTTRLPWIFVLTIAWLVAVLYLAFGAIWPLDWTHMRSHCRGWFRKGSLSPWEMLMVGKKKGRGILEFFGKT